MNDMVGPLITNRVKTRTTTIYTSRDNSTITILDHSDNKQKEKNESIDLEARARITFAASTDIDESKNSHVRRAGGSSDGGHHGTG
jgi:hypothetical protein